MNGYVISITGDTLHGFIDYRNWERNPNSIFFKEKLSDSKIQYSPIDIKEFGVIDEIYESAIVETEMSSDKTEDLEFNKELVVTIDTTFLQTMMRGSKSLYYYNNKLGKSQFYVKNGSSFELLVYKKFLQKENGVSVIYENRNFLGQLAVYLQDCPTIQSKLRSSVYRRGSMEKLFDYYHNCSKSEIQFQRKTPKATIEFGVLAGLSSTSINFSGEASFPYMLHTNYQPSTNFSAGLFLDLIFPRNHEKWSLCNELLLSSYKVSGRHTDYVNENKFTINSTTIALDYLKMNNLLRFKYPVGSMFVYLNGGISNGIVVNKTNYRKEETTFYTSITVNEVKALEEIRNYELGFILGLGSKYKRYSFEIRHERTDGISATNALKSTVKRYYFLLGYSF